jgi:hypothetical protein
MLPTLLASLRAGRQGGSDQAVQANILGGGFEMDMIDDIEFVDEETATLIASVVEFEAKPEQIMQ